MGLQPSDPLKRLARADNTAYGVLPPLPMIVLLAAGAWVAAAGPIAVVNVMSTAPTMVAPARAPRRSLRNVTTHFSVRVPGEGSSPTQSSIASRSIMNIEIVAR